MDGLSEAVRVLEAEGWLWVEPFKVSKPAIAKRLTLMSAEGSRYNRGGFIELGEYPRWFSGEMNADPLTIER